MLISLNRAFPKYLSYYNYNNIIYNVYALQHVFFSLVLVTDRLLLFFFFFFVVHIAGCGACHRTE